MKEQEFKDKVFSNGRHIWPAAAVFFSYFIFPDNEWLGALLMLLLAPAFIMRRWDGMILVWYGVVMLALAGLADNNDFAVTSFWMVVSGLLCLSAAFLGNKHGMD